jgi:hypothetical protein
MIPVYENYVGYRPPRYVRRAVAKVIQELPAQYLDGVESVVLTNGEAIGKGKVRHKGRKHARRECLGFYHPGKNGDRPWIEIVVDNAIAAFARPGWVGRVLVRLPDAAERLLKPGRIG